MTSQYSLLTTPKIKTPKLGYLHVLQLQATMYKVFGYKLDYNFRLQLSLKELIRLYILKIYLLNYSFLKNLQI